MTRQRFHLDDALAMRLPRIPPKTTFGGRNSAERRRITDYMAEIEPLLRQWLDEPERELGFVLQIGLPAGTDLLTHHDLDNFLEPLATHLGPRRVTFAAASKAYGDTSWLQIGEPRRAAERSWDGWSIARLSSTDTGAEAKRGLARTLATTADPLPPGPVDVDLAVRLGPTRNWVNAWKPLIDALVPILGRLPGKTEFDIEDGRITSLALHRTVDPSLGNEIELDLRWRMVPSIGDDPAVAAQDLTYEVGPFDDAPSPRATRTTKRAQADAGGRRARRRPLAAPAEWPAIGLQLVESVDRFQELKASGRGFVVITDHSNPPRLHRWTCANVTEGYFRTKVIAGRMKNGEYVVVPDPEVARQQWPGLGDDACVGSSI